MMEKAWLGLAFGWMILRFWEHYRNKRNLQFLKNHDCIQFKVRCTKVFYFSSVWVLPASYAEFVMMQEPVELVWAVFGFTLVSAGVLLRIWCIQSLGWLWTMECLHRPNWPFSTGGPYRIIHHPEYLARIVEGLGFALFLGSFVSATGFMILATASILPVALFENKLRRSGGHFDTDELFEAP